MGGQGEITLLSEDKANGEVVESAIGLGALGLQCHS
jgi:hypothetical protein